MGQALELEGPEVGEAGLGAAASHDGDHGRGQNLSALGRRDETSGLHHRGPEHVVLFEAHVPQGEPDPEGERRRTAACLAVDGLLHGRSAGHGISGRAEDGEDAIAQGLDLLAPGPLDGLPQGGEVTPAELIEGRLPEARQKVGGPDEVREEHRRRPARPSLPHKPPSAPRSTSSCEGEPTVQPGIRPPYWYVFAS